MTVIDELMQRNDPLKLTQGLPGYARDFTKGVRNDVLEEAAKACEVGIAESDPGSYNNACRNCAAAIRARKR